MRILCDVLARTDSTTMINSRGYINLVKQNMHAYNNWLYIIIIITINSLTENVHWAATTRDNKGWGVGGPPRDNKGWGVGGPPHIRGCTYRVWSSQREKVSTINSLYISFDLWPNLKTTSRRKRLSINLLLLKEKLYWFVWMLCNALAPCMHLSTGTNKKVNFIGSCVCVSDTCGYIYV